MSTEIVEHIDAEIVRTVDEWVNVIKADLGRAVEGVVSAGRNLVAAKAEVRHGEWLPMLKQIGISPRQAQELMSVGGNPAISNASNCAHLPTAARALYELSRLEPDEIETGIANGHITPDMTIDAAKAFARPSAPYPAFGSTEPKATPTTRESEPPTSQCIHCGTTLPLSQLYEGGEGYECDPCVQGEEEVPCRDCDGAGCETCFPAEDFDADECTGAENPRDPTSGSTDPEVAPKPRKKPSRPITDQSRDAGWELRRAVERIERIAADGRFNAQIEKVAPHLRGHLTDAITSCQAVLDRINSQLGE